MKTQSSLLSLPIVALLLVAATPARAGGIVAPHVTGNTLEAGIQLPLGIDADLAVEFEQVVGLSGANLGLSAKLLSAADVLALASRLPDSLQSVPAGFPVLLTIEPPASGGLSFSGVVTVEIYTHDLVYVAGSPLRLFSAPLGGDFEDITETNAAGSYRVRGSKGDFSEFLIVADARSVDTVIAAKFSRLDTLLTDYGSSIAPSVYSDLVTLLDEASTAYASDDEEGAIAKVEDFSAAVESASGTDIPDVWRSARDLTDVAGELRAAAATLRFSLALKANGGT